MENNGSRLLDNKTIILGTNNENKVREYKAILGKFGIDVISLKDAGINLEVEENGKTFVENAILKAKAIHDIVKAPVIGEDGGIEIDFLGGKPGVYSHRFLRRRYSKCRKMRKNIRNDAKS